MSEKLVSRRAFLATTAFAITGGLIAACSAPAPPASTPAPPAAAPTAAGQSAVAPTTGAAVKTSPSGVFRYAIDNDTETRKPVVEAFLAKNYPNLKAQFEVTPEGYFEKLLSQIAAKNPPDLAYIHESRFLDFASQGALQPLDDFMAKSPLIDGNDKYGLDIVKRNNSYKGHWYTMPIGLAYLFIRYNKTMFQQAGVPLPTENWTWDDFKRSAAALSKDAPDGKSRQWGYIGWDPSWMPSW